MLSTQSPELRPANAAPAPSSAMEAGRQRQGRLWSNLKEVCDLLHIPATCSVSTEELLFQHVQLSELLPDPAAWPAGCPARRRY
jgi:CRP/FNR family transcriptional regulator